MIKGQLKYRHFALSIFLHAICLHLQTPVYIYLPQNNRLINAAHWNSRKNQKLLMSAVFNFQVLAEAVTVKYVALLKRKTLTAPLIAFVG